LKNIVTKSILAIILRVAVMTVIDYFLLQLFYNMLEFDVVGLLFPIFNVIQTLINIILGYLDLFENIKIQEIR
jgi:lipoprotein signal peptidase